MASKERNARLRERIRGRGLIQVEVWVRPEDWTWLKYWRDAPGNVGPVPDRLATVLHDLVTERRRPALPRPVATQPRNPVASGAPLLPRDAVPRPVPRDPAPVVGAVPISLVSGDVVAAEPVPRDVDVAVTEPGPQKSPVSVKPAGRREVSFNEPPEAVVAKRPGRSGRGKGQTMSVSVEERIYALHLEGIKHPVISAILAAEGIVGGRKGEPYRPGVIWKAVQRAQARRAG